MAFGSLYDNSTGQMVSPSFGPSSGSGITQDYTGKTINPNPPNNDGYTGTGLNLSSPLPWQTNSNQYQNVGHDGSYNGMNREQWRDAWMSSGVKNQADTDSWLTGHGAQKIGDNGSFYTPFGEGLDLGIGYKTGSVTPGWTDTGLGTYGSNPLAQASGSSLGTGPNQFAPTPSVQNAISSNTGNPNGLLSALQELFGGYQMNGLNNVGGSNSIFNNALLSAVGNNNDKMDINSFLQSPMGLQRDKDNQFAPTGG